MSVHGGRHTGGTRWRGLAAQKRRGIEAGPSNLTHKDAVISELFNLREGRKKKNEMERFRHLGVAAG